MADFNIALDGPSGAGKSSMADALAEHFGLIHLDTGAMYRAAALYLDNQHLDVTDLDQIEKALENLYLEMKEDQILLNGTDVTKEIRKPEVSLLASRYSALPPVRKALASLQAQTAAAKGYILDGRDICDHVLPDAEVKMYLDAAPQARACRRLAQDRQKGIVEDYEAVLQDILERDERDRTRKTDPLKISKEAVVVDSTDMTIEETLSRMIEVVNDQLRKGAA